MGGRTRIEEKVKRRNGRKSKFAEFIFLGTNSNVKSLFKPPIWID